jgi:hypothetical protein
MASRVECVWCGGHGLIDALQPDNRRVSTVIWMKTSYGYGYVHRGECEIAAINDFNENRRDNESESEECLRDAICPLA